MDSHRTPAERVRDVRRLLEASREVHARRARLAPAIARDTGLSPEGVELGFGSLERDASDEDLRALVERAGEASQVHVVLSANVFVAPLRAIAVARAAAPRVTVSPSSRDPVLAHALVETLADPAVVFDAGRDVASIGEGEVHVFGRSETIAAVCARARVAVRAHGPGLGVAAIGPGSLEEAAESLAADVVPFDQRGCLSPRVALVVGDEARAADFAAALHERLGAWGARVPRGRLTGDEREGATRWIDAVTFAGRSWTGPDHAVALAPEHGPLSVPPAGRHVLVAGAPSWEDAFARLAPLSGFVVAVGTNDPARVALMRPVGPARARVLALGRMQGPPLDGPVDLR
jgi:hypothetical protein